VNRDLEGLIADAYSGVESSLGRLVTLLENDESSVLPVLAGVPQRPGRSGKACRIGITGPPGSGKSTLIDRLIGVIRAQGLTVGVLCVDPSSPLTGGAVLGDRIRMERHYGDAGVFIRSMASRGSLGGVSRAVGAAVDLLDACGKDVVIVETVGVGQEGIEVTKLVDVTVLVLAPGWGDNLQSMKAGILEVADVVVINKADLGTGDLATVITEILALGQGKKKPLVVETQALNDVGIEELYGALERLREKRAASQDRAGGSRLLNNDGRDVVFRQPPS